MRSTELRWMVCVGGVVSVPRRGEPLANKKCPAAIPYDHLEVVYQRTKKLILKQWLSELSRA